MIHKILLSLILTIPIFASAPQMQNRNISTKDMKKQNKLIVELAAKELSKTLPQKINQYTILINIKADDTILTYIYEINTSPKSDTTVRNEDNSKMQQAITIGTCKNSQRFLESGITVRYIYNSASTKDELFQFNIKQENCVK